MQERDKTKRTTYELFSGPVTREPAGKELFAGKVPGRDENRTAEAIKPSAPAEVKPPVASSSKGHFFWILVLLMLNCFMVGGILCYLLVGKDKPAVVSQIAVPPSQPETVVKPVKKPVPPIQKESVAPADLFKNIELSATTIHTLEQSVSLRTAELLYEAQDYFKACYVYNRLRDNLVTNELGDECLDNYLELKMALCLQKTQEQELMISLFGRAVESRSPVVRALAYYNLAYLQMHNKQYLQARTSAYRALALMESFETTMPETVEADCYFLAAEALTRYLLQIHNDREGLPGRLWSDTTPVVQVPLEDQISLKTFLTQGIRELNTGVVAPKIEFQPYREAGAQWSAICVEAPLEEVLWKYGSSTPVKMNWTKSDPSLRSRPVTLYFPVTSGIYLAEVAAGSTGLLWRYDGETAVLYDPEMYTDFDNHKEILVEETIAIWQRFLLRYRGDHRTPNAHFALGIMYTMENQIPTAMGEYKLISSQFPHNPLAPYALMNSSKLKTNLRDYDGARTDLNDLLIQYPECRLVDEASLYLAEATMEHGLYAEAEKMFEKVYKLNYAPKTRCRASYGLGKCAYEQGEYPKAQEWLTKAIDLTEASDDNRLGAAFYLLGRVCIEQKKYEQASMAFRAALDKKLSNDEYFQVTMKLIESTICEEHYVKAMELLESIPETKLSQEQTCDVMLVRSRILRDIDLTESAISLLRRKIEYIAEANLRARLSVELARCYLETGDLLVAEKELMDTIYDLEGKQEIQQAIALLAEVVYRRGRLELAEELCLQILSRPEIDPEIRSDMFTLLGRMYQDQQRYDQAALAYAGIGNPAEDSKP